jgi:hypothetical protein
VVREAGRHSRHDVLDECDVALDSVSDFLVHGVALSLWCCHNVIGPR